MADDTSAALIAQLDVKFDQLANNMKKAMTVFDDGGRKLERRQAQIKKNLSNWALDFSGLGGLNKALVGLTAGAAIGGLATLVKNGIDAAAAIGDVAKQAGVGVEFLQKMRFAATQNGASFDIMDSALTMLNKSLGDFVNTGGGKAAQTFKNLGIDKLINSGDIRNAEDLFDALVKKLQGVGSEAQKSGYLAAAFGKEAGPKLLQLVNQGIDGLAKLEAQAVSLGIVLSTQTVQSAKDAGDKLDALFSVMKAQGTAAIASLAPEIASLAQEITNGLPDLITWVEKWAQWFGLIKLSPADDLKVQLADANKEIAGIAAQRDKLAKMGPVASGLNAFGSIFGLGTSKDDMDVLYNAAVAKAADIKRRLAAATANTPPVPASTAKSGPILHVAQTPQEIALAQKRKELLAQTGVDAATARAALIVAQDQTNVQLLKGSADYYAAVKKQIDDEYQASVITAQAEADKQKATLGKRGTDWKGYAEGVANINATLTDKIGAAAEKQKQALFENGPGALIQQAIEQSRQQVEQYGYETAALGLTAGAAAKLAFQQNALADAHARQIPVTKELTDTINAQAEAVGAAAQAAHDAAESSADNIQVLDTLRSGLTEIGVAGVHGFKSLKDAASQFLNTLADTIVQLYVMKPLINSLLGPAGTSGGGSGGGFFGSLLSSLTGGGGSDLASATTSAIAANPLLFGSGGFTGPGGKNQPAGIVHKGEVVFSQADVRRAGGVSAVEMMRRRGYADGGIVGRPPISMPPAPTLPQMSGGATVVQNIDLRGAVVDKDVWAQVNEISQQNAQQAVAIYDRKVLPGRVQTLNKFPRRMH